jgi:hypothetical protein
LLFPRCNNDPSCSTSTSNSVCDDYMVELIDYELAVPINSSDTNNDNNTLVEVRGWGRRRSTMADIGKVVRVDRDTGVVRILWNTTCEEKVLKRCFYSSSANSK